MMPPTWLLDSFAAVMLVVAAVSAARQGAWWRFRTEGADVDAAHLLMAVAMAGMLASGLRTLPDGAWETAFAVATAWFAWRVVRDARAYGVRAGGRALRAAPRARRRDDLYVRRASGGRGHRRRRSRANSGT